MYRDNKMQGRRINSMQCNQSMKEKKRKDKRELLEMVVHIAPRLSLGMALVQF